MPKYENIPVDKTTKQDLIVLAKRFGLGDRGQGAMVRILVSEKLQKLGISGGPMTDENVLSLPAGNDDAVVLPAIDDVA